MKDRKGEYIITYTGRRFWPLDPQEDEICIEDIAHSLSNQCRFAGHTSSFYSVAQHSVMVAKMVPVSDAIYGLLHDASEAYLVDLPSPIKHSSRMGNIYKQAEKKVMSAVMRRFGLKDKMPRSVIAADEILLEIEINDLMSRHTSSAIIPLVPILAKWSFLELAKELMKKPLYV